MRTSLFPSDESLPTWLHTLLLIIVVSPFAGWLFWFGLGAAFLAIALRFSRMAGKGWAPVRVA